MTNLMKLVTDQINQSEERPSLIKTPTMRPTDASIRITSPSGRQYIKGQCHRSIYYRVKQVPPTNPPTERMPWIWWIGKAFEDKCQELMKESGILSMDNPRFVDNRGNYILHGEMDAIAIDKTVSPTEFYIVEFKNTGGYFAKAKLMGSARKYKPAPKEENLMQTMVYLDHVGEEVKYALLFYLIRDDMSITQFKIRLEEHDGKRYPRIANRTNNLDSGDLWLDYPIEGIYDRYEELANLLKEDIKPPREYSAIYSEEEARALLTDGELSKNQFEQHMDERKVQGDWVCNFCQFKDHCYGESE